MQVTYTRRPARMRIKARLMCWYWRLLIVHAESDLKRHQREMQHALDHLPAQIDLDKAYIDSLVSLLTRTEHNL